MVLSTAAIVLALAVNGVPASTDAAAAAARSPHTAVHEPMRAAVHATVPLERWQIDAREARPAALPILYASLGALQVADVYSTRHAIGANAYEANPIVRSTSKHAGAMLAVKALSTAGTIYFAERAWKKNRAGAVVLVAVINGLTAAVTARNLRNAR
jgi:hypothetical protein